MARCPKCSFALVLLSQRNKYKCAKCSGLYLANEIDNREFRDWNKRQREIDVESLKSKRLKKTEEEKQQYKKEYWNKNRETILENQRNWYIINKEQINVKRRELYQESSYNIKRKERRHKNIEGTRQLSRIHFWRQKQKILALEALENIQYKACKPKILISPPTFLLSELLLFPKCL